MGNIKHLRKKLATKDSLLEKVFHLSNQILVAHWRQIIIHDEKDFTMSMTLIKKKNLELKEENLTKIYTMLEP